MLIRSWRSRIACSCLGWLTSKVEKGSGFHGCIGWHARCCRSHHRSPKKLTRHSFGACHGGGKGAWTFKDSGCSKHRSFRNSFCKFCPVLFDTKSVRWVKNIKLTLLNTGIFEDIFPKHFPFIKIKCGKD
jgi:hypothetical protein